MHIKKSLFSLILIGILSLTLTLELAKVDSVFWTIKWLFPPFTVIFLCLFVLYTILAFITKRIKISLIATLFLGTIFFQFENLQLYFGAEIAFLAIVMMLLGSVLFYKFEHISIKLYDFFILYTCLNLVLASLLTLNGVHTAKYDVQKIYSPAPLFEKQEHKLLDSGKLPDIYYIIPDGYARASTLEDYYNYSNDEFLNHIKGKGFFVDGCAHANYPYTDLSLSSAVNFNYIHSDFLTPEEELYDRAPLVQHMQHSRIEAILKKNDYTTHFISRSIEFVAGYNEDIFKKPDIYLFNKTPIPFALQLFFGSEHSLLNLYARERQSILDEFQKIQAHIKMKSEKPKFVLAHLTLPHSPFLFDETGNPLKHGHVPLYYIDGHNHAFDHEFAGGWESHYEDNYPRQLQYTNKLIQRLIDDILMSANQRPFVIIIQSDHGSRLNWHPRHLSATNLNEVFPIVSAYYFSDQDYSLISTGMTPVNTFRVILNKYFDYNLPILENKAYYANFYAPFNQVDVTDQLALCH